MELNFSNNNKTVKSIIFGKRFSTTARFAFLYFYLNRGVRNTLLPFALKNKAKIKTEMAWSWKIPF